MRFLHRTILTATGIATMLIAVLLHPCRGADEPAPVELSAWLKSAVRDGRVKVEFYDPAKSPRPYPGWTDFEFKLKYRYEYKVDWHEVKPRRHVATITPTFTSIEVPVTHHVQLPVYVDSPRWFQFQLGRHELEHVVIGSQPRLKMLGERLIRRITRIERTVAKTSDVTDEWVTKVIDEEVAPRNKAIETLVGNINREFDKRTEHGSKSLEDPQVYFANLYSKEHLDEMKFPYLGEVADLLNSREYQKAGWKADRFPIEMPPKK